MTASQDAARLREFLEALLGGRAAPAPPRLLPRMAREALARRRGDPALGPDDLVSGFLLRLLERREAGALPALLASRDDRRLVGYVRRCLRNVAQDLDPSAADRRALAPHVRRACRAAAAGEPPPMPAAIAEGGRYRYELVRDAVAALRALPGLEGAGPAAMTARLARLYAEVPGAEEPALDDTFSSEVRRRLDAPVLARQLREQLGPVRSRILALRRGRTLAEVGLALGLAPQRVLELQREAAERLRRDFHAYSMASLHRAVDLLETPGSEGARPGAPSGRAAVRIAGSDLPSGEGGGRPWTRTNGSSDTSAAPGPGRPGPRTGQGRRRGRVD